MELKLSLIIIIFIVVFVITVVNMIRNEKLGLKYALSWIVMSFFIFVSAVMPNFITILARLIGVVTPINAVFFLGFIFSLIIIFTLTVALSRTSNKVTKLTQEVALLQKNIELIVMKQNNYIKK